jgi:hypothetical protein
MNFCRLTIQEPIFSVSNTEFEGGDDGHSLGDCTILAKQAQPSHTWPYCIGEAHTHNNTGMRAPGVLCDVGLRVRGDPNIHIPKLYGLEQG